MARSRTLPGLALLAGTGLLALVAGSWGGGQREPRETPRPAVVPSASARDAPAFMEEAIRLYAAGQFPRACAEFERAADDAPSRPALRQDVGRCFEGWGWQALRQGRPDEAIVLFRQGLLEAPGDPTLLRGLGLAAVHAGRPDEAVATLETAVAREPDAQVRLLLAYLYEHRDDPGRAIHHLRAVLDQDPGNERARRLLDKVERERQTEAGFQRDLTPHFVVKSRGARTGEARGTIARLLERARERVGTELAYRPRERLTVVLYERDQFRDVTGVHGWVTGLFDGKIRLPIGATLPPVDDLERLIVHEYAHAAIHELTRGRAPRWLHEGLAQALEGAAPDPMLRVPGSPTLAGLEALVADPDPLRARTGYEVALWVVRDLLDRGGMEAMRELLARLGAGETLEEATPRVYGLRMADIEFQWRRLLGG